jgi:hypothetical protein
MTLPLQLDIPEGEFTFAECIRILLVTVTQNGTCLSSLGCMATNKIDPKCH